MTSTDRAYKRSPDRNRPNVISEHQQNKLAQLYPYWFDRIPDRIPAPLLFGPDYTIDQELSLEDLISMKGQKVQAVHAKGIEYENQSVLSSYFVQTRNRKLRSRSNWLERLEAGTVSKSELGIVGNNLDKCIHETLKKTREARFNAQAMIQKVRLDGKPIVSKAVRCCGSPLGELVEVQSNSEFNSSSVNGVQTCGSVWACPVCRDKILSERADEAKEIYKAWTERGGSFFMITLTAPHSSGDNLAELYGSSTQKTGLTGALGRFRSSRTFSKDFKAQADYFGDLRSIEVTWGRANGFHPHIHMLILAGENFCIQEWKSRFYKEWSRCCTKSGLQEPSWERGVVISKCQTEEQAVYPVKWSVASELTSQSMKTAKPGNFSISELERCLWDREFRSKKKMGMTQASCILRAYYGAMKGQRMIQTGGIGPEGNWKKELLGIPDSEEESPEVHSHICYLTDREYLKIKRNGDLPGLLSASERGTTAKDRKKQLIDWMNRKGYDRTAVRTETRPPPVPLCFAYLTQGNYATS